MWEREGRGRIGVEVYFAGQQRLEDNPYRSQSESCVLCGGLVERRFGRVQLFVNAENLGESVRPGSIRSSARFRRPTDDGPSMPGRHSTGA